MWIVYKHQNLQNGKVYIGITSQDVEERCKKRQKYTKGYHWEYIKGEKGHD